jgi:hypothetical protein
MREHLVKWAKKVEKKNEDVECKVRFVHVVVWQESKEILNIFKKVAETQRE